MGVRGPLTSHIRPAKRPLSDPWHPSPVLPAPVVQLQQLIRRRAGREAPRSAAEPARIAAAAHRCWRWAHSSQASRVPAFAFVVVAAARAIMGGRKAGKPAGHTEIVARRGGGSARHSSRASGAVTPPHGGRGPARVVSMYCMVPPALLESAHG